MAIITIDSREYNTDELGEETKKQLNALKLIDAELRKLQIQTSIANSAKNYHSQLLRDSLAEDPLNGDTIRFD